MFRSSSEKMEESFTVISNTAVATRVPINQKGTDLFIKGIFEPGQSVSFVLRSEKYFQVTKTYRFNDTIDQTRS